MDKRYQIFVSSTFEDLQEERREVMQALLSLDCIPTGMELFPAADEESWELIKRFIADPTRGWIFISSSRRKRRPGRRRRFHFILGTSSSNTITIILRPLVGTRFYQFLGPFSLFMPPNATSKMCSPNQFEIASRISVACRFLGPTCGTKSFRKLRCNCVL